MEISAYQKLITTNLDSIRQEARHPRLAEILEYACQTKGKRIRPVLCLLGHQMFKEDPNLVINQALALEIFHNFTLVHDDIMDEAPLRRGAKSVYTKYSRDDAILAGDVLMIIAYRYLLKELPEAYTNDVMDCFSTMAVQVCEGQMMDMDLEEHSNPLLTDYLKMIELKTSVLLGAAFKIGALCGGAGIEQANILYKYGVLNGIAFQIQDDLLDVYGESSAVGKQSGGDIIRGKKTALSILCHERAQADGLNFFNILNQDVPDRQSKVQEVKQLYQKYGIREEVISLKEQYVKESEGLLDTSTGNTKVKHLIRVLFNQLNHRTN